MRRPYKYQQGAKRPATVEQMDLEQNLMKNLMQSMQWTKRGITMTRPYEYQKGTNRH